MKSICLIGSSFRHTYIANMISRSTDLIGVIVEQREEAIPPTPEGLEEEIAEYFVRHFEDRFRIEKQYFGEYNLDIAPNVLAIEKDELNGPKVRSFLKALGADVGISYGVHVLDTETLACMPDTKWNCHGGLSPWYRGAITHFWPSYMLEPQLTGVTLHNLTSRLDGGEIVHQTCADLSVEDGIHDIACKAVNNFGLDLVDVLKIFNRGELKPAVQQKSAGKLWLARDWRPEHLKLIYGVFNNQVAKAYLEDRFQKRDPELIRQFD